MIPIERIDDTWTLFFDRDGVINYEKPQDYIHTWHEFRFYEGVKSALRQLSKVFNRIIVITNQKGVGKGLTKLDDLHTIHYNMQHEIEMAGGRLDAIYYCSDIEELSPFRKPNPGMGFQAVQQFPEIDLSKAIMVGNTAGDMEFGRNLGVYTAFLLTTQPQFDRNDPRVDAFYTSLPEFANAIAGKL